VNYTFKSPCRPNQTFNVVYVYVVFLKCFKTNHVLILKSAPLLSIFSLELQWTKDTVSMTGDFEMTGVSEYTNYLVTNQINIWSSPSGCLSWCEWVEAGLICIFIGLSKLIEARGVGLHSSYFKRWRRFLFVFFSQGKTLTFIILVIKD